MREVTLSMLCNPYTGEPFKLVNGSLVGTASGQTFPIRQGIPVILQKDGLSLRSRYFNWFYDRTAFAYDQTMKWSDILGSSSEEKLRREYVAALPVQPGDKVLDCATGTGSNLLHLPAHGEYYAQDISWQMLQRAEKKLHDVGRFIELFQCDGAALPFRNNSFDLVLQLGALQYFSDPFHCVSEMARAAKPGSVVHILDEISSGKRMLQRMPAHALYTTSQSSILQAIKHLAPHSMLDVESEILPGGDFYVLRFRKPG
jgi:ubiquinone/menaquinone biosynthesis C-methylase UbiE